MACHAKEKGSSLVDKIKNSGKGGGLLKMKSYQDGCTGCSRTSGSLEDRYLDFVLESGCVKFDQVLLCRRESITIPRSLLLQRLSEKTSYLFSRMGRKAMLNDTDCSNTSH